jgi:hypothetical protein
MFALRDGALGGRTRPFWYLVEDSSFTVTSWLAEVGRVKLDLATFPTVPEDPPAAGPDRALEPWAPPPKCPGERLEATDWAAPAEEDPPTPTTNPASEPINAVATISPASDEVGVRASSAG